MGFSLRRQTSSFCGAQGTRHDPKSAAGAWGLDPGWAPSATARTFPCQGGNCCGQVRIDEEYA